MDSLLQFARIRAAIEQGGDRGQVLREAGLAPADWIQLQRRWLDALAAEIANGSDTLATRYCEAFESAQSPVVAAEQPVAVAEAAAPSTHAPKPAAVAVDAPSYLKAPIAPLPIAPSHQDLRGTSLAFEVPQMPAMPFKQGSPVATAEPPKAPPAPKASPPLHGGTMLALDVPRGPAPAMPFRSGTDMAVEPSVAAGSGTEGASSTAAGRATPFEALDPEALGFNLTRYADLVAARSESGADMTAVLAEMKIDADAHARIEAYWRRRFAENGLLALDFGRLIGQAKKARADRRAPRPAAPFGTGTSLAVDAPRAPATPFDSGSGTAGARSTPPGPATPFEAPPPEALGFNLIRYADLVAARSEPGADMAAVLAELEIDTDAHGRIEAYWSRKFAESGLLALEFGRLLTQAKKARADKRAPRPAAPFGTGTSLALDVPRSAMPFAAEAAEPAATTPLPGPVAPPQIPELSVDQYAWIVASLRKATDVPAVLARFRLTPETRKELEARWAKRMAADQTLRETFIAALGRHLGGGTG